MEMKSTVFISPAYTPWRDGLYRKCVLEVGILEAALEFCLTWTHKMIICDFI